MITCVFEKGYKASLRHIVTHDQFAFDHGESIRVYLEYRRNKFPLPLFI